MSFSIKSGLAALAYIALALAACFDSSQILADVFFLATFLILVFAAVMALYASPQYRPAWTGFTLAATSYLALTVYPGQFQSLPATRLGQWVNDLLAPIRIERWSIPVAPVPIFVTPNPYTPPASMDPIYVTPNPFPPSASTVDMGLVQANTVRMIHAIFAMLLGLAAAELARRTIARQSHVEERLPQHRGEETR